MLAVEPHGWVSGTINAHQLATPVWRVECRQESGRSERRQTRVECGAIVVERSVEAAGSACTVVGMRGDGGTEGNPEGCVGWSKAKASGKREGSVRAFVTELVERGTQEQRLERNRCAVPRSVRRAEG